MSLSSSRPPITVCLFDLDGTLLDTNDLILKSFQYTLENQTIVDPISPLSEDAIRKRFFGRPLQDAFEQFTLDPVKVQELMAFYRKFNLAQHDLLAKEFKDLLRVITTFHEKGIKLAVVTSKNDSTARRGLELAHMTKFFPILVAADTCPLHKPNPGPALAALEQLGETAGPHVLFIGDAPPDIECGKKAGCLSAAVGWTALDRTEIQRATPDFWVESPADLLSLVLPTTLSTSS